MATSPSALPIGQLPPVGEIPDSMLAQVIRRERFGEPRDAFQVEEVGLPPMGPDEVLVGVMAAGINYNNVWAAKGVPIDVIGVHEKLFGDTTGFHIGGSDASGIVYAVGDKVRNVAVGDHVVTHCMQWDWDDPAVIHNPDPMFAPSVRVWGYETNWGSFAQFTVVQDHQCMPKARHLTWEQAAAPTLVGQTAYRMLHGWDVRVEPGDVVLVWGASGGLGCQAVQLVVNAGGIAVAVVSSQEKGEYAVSLGARGYINRNDFDHWGPPPDWRDSDAYAAWTKQAQRFGKAIWGVVGERRNPRIVFEHPGEDTIPTSVYVVEPGGMVVVCAGTSGYMAHVDLRYLWMRQKRVQGSHASNALQANRYNNLVRSTLIDPCLTRTFAFEEIGEAHQLMSENRLGLGNTAARVGAPHAGLTGAE
jgi:crotonyl-CoA carboxylase/reductase